MRTTPKGWFHPPYKTELGPSETDCPSPTDTNGTPDHSPVPSTTEDRITRNEPNPPPMMRESRETNPSPRPKKGENRKTKHTDAHGPPGDITQRKPTWDMPVSGTTAMTGARTIARAVTVVAQERAAASGRCGALGLAGSEIGPEPVGLTARPPAARFR